MIKKRSKKLLKKESSVWNEFGERKSKINKFFQESKIEKIKNEQIFEDAVETCRNKKSSFY